MSLGFCPLDDAFPTKTGRKKNKKFKVVDEQDKILNRGLDVDRNAVQSNDLLDNHQSPQNCLNVSEMNKVSMTYNENNELSKLRDQVKLLTQENRDKGPNEWQEESNQNANNFLKDIQTGLFKLQQEIKELKSLKPADKEYHIDNQIEGFENYKPNRNITFDNDQFNELLLYIFTGIFLLILIDYVYKLGQKSF